MSNKKNIKFDGESFPGHKPFAKIWSQDYGINSDVFLYKYFDSNKKSVMIKFGARKGGFKLENAIEMTNDILLYQDELEKRLIPLPPIEKMNLEYNPVTHKIEIIKTSTWTGSDIGKIIKDIDYTGKEKELERLLVEMCKIVKCVCREKVSKWEIEVGIDPRATNFTLDENNNVWFIDLFPPRFRKNGTPIIEWPEPESEIGVELGYFKHYDVRGVILCMTAQLARLRPEHKEYFEKIVHEEFKEVFSKKEYDYFLESLANTPWMKLRKILKDKKINKELKYEEAQEIILNSLNVEIFEIDYYIYTLREIALEMAHSNIMSDKDVKDFFASSHFEDRLPKNITDSLIRVLIKHLEKIRK